MVAPAAATASAGVEHLVTVLDRARTGHQGEVRATDFSATDLEHRVLAPFLIWREASLYGFEIGVR